MKWGLVALAFVGGIALVWFTNGFGQWQKKA